jgi:uncharacterized protein
MLTQVSISVLSIIRPRYLFARASEWAAPEAIVEGPGAETRLGLVYGRRRQGKTLLLEALCDATRGFMWQHALAETLNSSI